MKTKKNSNPIGEDSIKVHIIKESILSALASSMTLTEKRTQIQAIVEMYPEYVIDLNEGRLRIYKPTVEDAWYEQGDSPTQAE